MERFDSLDYWERRHRESVVDAAVGCLGLSESYNRWLRRMKARSFQEAIRSIRWEWADKRVLDIGTGTGFCIEQWRRTGVRQLVGSDFTAEAVQGLSGRWSGVDVIRMDITHANLPVDGRFDAISALDVFFHITDDDAYRRALNNVGRLLRPGGYFLCTENFLHGREERSGHLVSRELGRIEAMMRAAGLVPVRRNPVFVLMNRPIDSSSRLLQWFWDRVESLAAHEVAGWIAGATLFPIDTVLTKTKPEGPSTELMVCRRPPRSSASGQPS
jgi:SAM-dependent methyltransferase